MLDVLRPLVPLVWGRQVLWALCSVAKNLT
jgi:hypothetical protein